MTIIGITGKKQSGKDTTLTIIRKCLSNKNIIRLAFADALKKEIAAAAQISVEDIEKNKDNFRLVLQGWGTDFRRKLCGDDYWIRKWHKAIDYIEGMYPDAVIVAPDCRFTNEAVAIKARGGLIFRVTPSTDRDGPADAHVSETEMSAIEADSSFTNDFTNINVLIAQVQEAMKKYNLYV